MTHAKFDFQKSFLTILHGVLNRNFAVRFDKNILKNVFKKRADTDDE